MQTQSELLRLSSANLLLPPLSPPPFPHSLSLSSRRTNSHCSLCSAHKAWLAQISDQLATTAIAAAAATSAPPPEDGPTELPSSITTLLLAADDTASLQTATSILLTGVFTLFLFRSLRRRAKRAKETRLRSGSLKEEALKKASDAPIKAKSPPSADEAFLGAVIAAAFGVLLYKFTKSIEYTLNHQVLSNNYSVRQITITIRTVINGLCYLATFVFGFNSLGLFLYSGQLALNSFVDVPIGDNHEAAPLNSNSPDHSRSSSTQSSDKTENEHKKRIQD